MEKVLGLPDSSWTEDQYVTGSGDPGPRGAERCKAVSEAKLKDYDLWRFWEPEMVPGIQAAGSGECWREERSTHTEKRIPLTHARQDGGVFCSSCHVGKQKSRQSQVSENYISQALFRAGPEGNPKAAVKEERFSGSESEVVVGAPEQGGVQAAAARAEAASLQQFQLVQAAPLRHSQNRQAAQRQPVQTRLSDPGAHGKQQLGRSRAPQGCTCRSRVSHGKPVVQQEWPPSREKLLLISG
ncbi:hypothetical protein CB1_001085004 [Camelus ferus]|nr:hypothetical protein CB1_001085004 [Camelus ferus]